MIGGDDQRKISQGGPEEEGRAVRPKEAEKSLPVSPAGGAQHLPHSIYKSQDICKFLWGCMA